jgi:hypothetical protein
MLRARRALLVFILGLRHGNRCITMPTFAPFLKNAELVPLPARAIKNRQQPLVLKGIDVRALLRLAN